MKHRELQSTFELVDNIEFERKVDIEDLVFPSELTSISNMETIDIKEEPLHQSRNMISIHESNKSGESLMVHESINSSSFATVADRNESFQPEVVLRHSGMLPSKPIGSENEVFFNQKLKKKL